MELALSKVEEIKPIERKIIEAKNTGVMPRESVFELSLKSALEQDIISMEEANKLKEFENLRLKVIQVDEFEPDYLSSKKKN